MKSSMTPKIKEHVGRACNVAVSGHRRRAERRLRLSRGQMPRLRYAPDCRPRHCPLTQNHTCARTGTLYALQRMLGGAAVCVQAQSVDRAAIQQARLRAAHRKCGRTIGLVSCGLKVIKHLLLLRRCSSQFSRNIVLHALKRLLLQGALHLAWRIGMTAPVFERGLGPFLKTTRSVCDPPCLPLGLPCSFRPYWSGLSYRRMRHRLSQHVRRSVRPRRMAATPPCAAPTTDGVGNP
jgi:hypothetical protein